MAVDEKTEEESLDWNVDTEVQLFHAMRGHKPVGVNRFFQMACIHEKFSNSINREVNSQNIWDRLETMYDMPALHESEILPFPNDELEFALPHGDFGKLLADRNGGESIPIPTSTKVKVELKRPDPHEGRSKSGKEVYTGGKTKHDTYSSSNSTTSTSSNVSSKTSKAEMPVPPKTVKTEDKSKDSPETNKVKVESKKEAVSITPAKTSSSPTIKTESVKSSKQESKSGKESLSKNTKTEEKESKKKLENVTTPKTTRSDSTSSSSSKTSKTEANASSNSGGSSGGKSTKADGTQKKKDDTKSTKESKATKGDPDDIPLSKISIPKNKRHDHKDENSIKRKRPTRTPDSSSSSRNNTPNVKRRRT